MVTFNEGNGRGPQDFVRQLGRIRGIVNERVTHMTENGAAIDFRMGFPSNPLVLHTNRVGGIGNSSISLNADGEVDTFALRYPPLPADVWQPTPARQMMYGVLADIEDSGKIEVQINPGTSGGDVEEWWPHLLYLNFITLEQEYVLDLIRGTLPKYIERSREKTQRLRQKNG